MRLPLPPSLQSPSQRTRGAWIALRLTLSGLIAAHGWARWLAGGVVPFGAFLEAQGFPAGFYWAAAITVLEVVGSVVLALGRVVAPLCVAFTCVYAAGILLVHSKAGWFVVGLGRNGSEYSVLLIIVLLAVGLQHVRSHNEA
jgi:putative oxidoreductase